MRTFIVSLALGLALASAAPAAAQSAPPTSVGTSVATDNTGAKGPSVWGILPWSGIGVGARFMIPLGIKPLIANANVRDSFALEFGADFLHWSYGFAAFNHDYSWSEVVPVVGAMWNVWLNSLSPKLAVYPKLDLGYAFGWFSNWDSTYTGPRPTYGGFFWDVALGALYKLDNGITLRAEAGYAGLKLGAGWLF